MSAFSMIVCNIKKAPEGEPKDEDARELIDLIRKLRGDLLGPPPRDPIAGLTVQAVTPNWLMSSASNSGGTGGPGSDPVPFKRSLGLSAISLLN
jgi:hypothetical protein